MLDIQVKKKLLSAEGEIMLDVALKLQKGELVALTGPSGSGKTTLLRIIAGLTNADAGKIACEDEFWLDMEKKVNLPPQQRRVGMVFQDYALFPNMTVQKNLIYALRRGQSKQIVDELIQIMELEALVGRYPPTLSGGQQQRVALARALVNQPEILLLDEPLSALDLQTRAKLQDYILQLHHQYHLTILLVTHDVSEIVKMSNRVLLLESGNLSESPYPPSLLEGMNLQGILKGKKIRIINEDNHYFLEVFIENSLLRLAITETEAHRLQNQDGNINLRINPQND